MEYQMSRNLFMKTQINESCDASETSAMLLLENAIAEAKRKNYKKAVVEFNQSFIEASGNEDVFTSKLLELTLKDLENLFICIFGCDKNRRFSKQHEKRLSSLKKKSSQHENEVGFANDAYDIDYIAKIKDQPKSQSLRGYKPPSHLDDNSPIKECLRKAYYLSRDLSNYKTLEKCVRTVLEIHCRAGNFFPCATLIFQHREKKFIDKIIMSLDDEQKIKLCHICIFISTNSKEIKSSVVEKSSCDAKLEYSLLACRILPQDEKANELLCHIYRQRSNFQKAFNTAKTFLDVVKPSSKALLIQLLMCDIECGKKDFVMERLDQLIKQYKDDISEFMILKAFLLMERSNIKEAMELIHAIKNPDCKLKIKYLTEQLNDNLHEAIINENYKYYDEWKKINNNKSLNNEEKTIFLLMAQLLAAKRGHELKYAKLYGDCLSICDEHEVVSQYFVQLIKCRENESLPMIHLATLRLKMGAYNAATEDFRAIISIIGNEKFVKDLSTLTQYEREEIARVHRVHAFKYLTKSLAYEEAAECFSVAICALGSNAAGIHLMRGFCNMHLNKFKEAKYDYDKCLEIDRSVVSAIFARAVVYAVTTHVEEAIKDFVNAYKMSSQACKQSITKLPLEHILTFSQLVIQYIKQEIERVRTINNNLFEISEINRPSKTLENMEPFNVEVVKYCDFLCTIFPNNLDYISTFIECLHVQKDTNNALRHIEVHINRFPGNTTLFAWKAVLLASLKRFDEALITFQYIVEIDEQIQRIFSFINTAEKKRLLECVFHQAVYLSSHENYHGALTLYDAAVSLSNKEVRAIKGRMRCYEKLGDTLKWKQDLCDIISLEPTASLLQMRAKHYQSIGENYLACEDFMTALELNEGETIINTTINANGSDVVEMFYNTAWQMLELGRPKVVLRLCETGLKFDHKHKGLKQLKDGAKTNLTKCSIQ